MKHCLEDINMTFCNRIQHKISRWKCKRLKTIGKNCNIEKGLKIIGGGVY